MTITASVAKKLRRTERMADVPHAKAAAKVATTITGLGVAFFGALLTAAGVFVLVKVPFTAWLLLVPAGGVALVLVGGIVISKDVAIALAEAAGITRKFARAVRGKNGDHPPAAES